MINHKMIESSLELAKNYVDKNFTRFGCFPLREEEKEHVARMIASALQTKHEFGYIGGSFVQALVKNDLYGAIAYADSVNQRAIALIVSGLYNIGLLEIERLAEERETLQ